MIIHPFSHGNFLPAPGWEADYVPLCSLVPSTSPTEFFSPGIRSGTFTNRILGRVPRAQKHGELLYPQFSHIYLVGGLEHWNMNFMTFHILGISSSQLTFTHIFQRGRSTTNLGYKWAIFNCHVGVSINGGYPKWMVYFLESPFLEWMRTGGTPHFRKLPCFMKLGRFIELDDGKNYRKALYLMVKTMVSCRFSLKPIQW